jgi:hypothetical protein
VKHRSRGPAVAVFVLGAAVLAAGCGGGGNGSSTGKSAAPAAPPPAFTPQSADFSLALRSKIGTHDAHVTLASRSDGKTDAVVDFYVPRTKDTRDDMYEVSVQEGDCASLGSTTISLGELPAGVTTVLLEEGFDEAVKPLQAGSASLVITEPDKKTIAWCGPSS